MGFKFESLKIWQKAMEFGENLNKVSRSFPKEEFSLHYEFAFNLMNMMAAFKEKIK